MSTVVSAETQVRAHDGSDRDVDGRIYRGVGPA